MSRPVRTTTLLVQKPQSFDVLKSKYKLVRYKIPYKYTNMGKSKFPKLHIEIKEQITYPYYAHTKALFIYVLYPSSEQVKSINLGFLSENDIPHHEITDLNAVPLHVILKLMFADYFRQPNRGMFVSQGAYYVYVMPVVYQGKHQSDKCLEIEVKGRRGNNVVTYPDYESFQIKASARRFAPVDKSKIEDWMKYQTAYFKKSSPQDGLVFFSQLRIDEIDDHEEDIYQIRTVSNKRTRIHYHIHSKPEKSRGKILFDFIGSFVQFLKNAGLEAKQQYRQVEEYKPQKSDKKIFDHLEKVRVFDNRIVTDIELHEYVESLSQRYSSISFEEVTNLYTDDASPVLLLQDYTGEDFDEGGLLYEFGDDPKLGIYADPNLMHIPKQTINVNATEETWENPDDYLAYDLVSFKKDKDKKTTIDYSRNFDVALTQLLLKHLVINPASVVGVLPQFIEINETEEDTETEKPQLSDYIFVRKKTYNGTNYWILLHVVDDQLEFVDLRSPSGKGVLYDKVEELGLDWDVVFKELRRKKFKEDDDRDDAIWFYDLIVGHNLVVEVEDINEIVLYEYDKIQKRKSDRTEPHSFDYFLLSDKYDDVRTADKFSLRELKERGLLSGTKPSNQKEERSVDFYYHLQKYDDFIDELSDTRIEISFDELTSKENLKHIGEILGFTPNKKGEYSRRSVWNMYKRGKMFPGDKEGDVHLYQGIWYDNEYCYIVGANQDLKDIQPNAHRIRKFDVLFGQGNFNIDIWLATLGVTFVRHKQFTVVPFPFNLIDMYVENVLQLQDEDD